VRIGAGAGNRRHSRVAVSRPDCVATTRHGAVRSARRVRQRSVRRRIPDSKRVESVLLLTVEQRECLADTQTVEGVDGSTVSKSNLDVGCTEFRVCQWAGYRQRIGDRSETHTIIQVVAVLHFS